MQHEENAGFRSGFVALVGCPNVGKSTLLNRLIGEKVAITSPVPQTTRQAIRGVLTLPGAQLVFVDTPGFHIPKYLLNKAMVASAGEAMADVDVVVMLVDAGRPPGEGDRHVAELCHKPGQRRTRPVILALNKWDTVRAGQERAIEEAYRALGPFADVVRLCSLDASAPARLLPAILPRVPEGPPYYPDDQMSDQTLRDLISELVREQVILQCAAEIPYSVLVVVDRYEEGEERTDGEEIDRIWATLYVERASQKGILLGKGGSRIKSIGQKAREQMESAIGRKVFLSLFVKVHANWRKDAEFLREMGFTL